MSKGEETRERILDTAIRLASRDGLDGLTVGTLAAELGLSKSGLFAHFGSKDALQVQVLQATVERFEASVVRPALKAPRGEPRLRTLLDRWLAWTDSLDMPGGCLIVVASVELDDRPGEARDLLVGAQRQLFAMLERMARGAVEEGQFRADLDVDQLAFELYALILGYHHRKRLLRDARAESRVRAAFERLFQSARS